MSEQTNFSNKSYSKGYAAFNISVFVSLLIMFSVLFFILPKQTVSEAEKRELATMPTFTAEALTSGTYTEDLSLYYADNFALRDFWVSLTAEINNYRGFSMDNARIHGAPAPSVSPTPPPSESNLPLTPPTDDSQSSTSQSSSEPESTAPEEELVGEQLGATFVYDNRGMPIFGGDPSIGVWYANTVSSYAALLGEDVNIYNMIIPTSIEYYLPERYSEVSHPQKPAIDNIYNNLSGGVIGVDAYSNLLAHKDEYIYFNTDHHWTALGAYYAYEAFAKDAGFDPIPLDELESTRIENFIGTLYAWTQDASLLENPDYVDYYTINTPHTVQMTIKDQPYYPYASTLYAHGVKGSNAYMVFIHGDQPMMKITTENKNGKKICVVKESYGNAFIPFLVNHYEEVYVVDGRYFQTALIPLLQNNNVTDLLFLNNISSAYTPYNIQRFETMKYQVYTPPVVEEEVPPTTDGEDIPELTEEDLKALEEAERKEEEEQRRKEEEEREREEEEEEEREREEEENKS